MGGDGYGKGRGRFAFKVLCPNELIARMLGKGGSRKDQLQDETGCRIIISGRDDYFPGTHFRVLVILGDAPEAMLGVIEHLIPDIVEFGKKERAPAGNVEADFAGPEAGQYIIRCIVTKQMSSAIIGPKGNNARAIREESSCKVVIDSSITAGHQQVKLIGEPRGLHIAVNLVNRYIQDQFGTPGYTEWATVKSFDRAGNPVHCSPGELNYSMGKGDRGDWGDWGERDDRERTPRGHAMPAMPAPGPARRAAIPPPSSLTGKTDKGDVDSALLDALCETAGSFPPGTLDTEYTIACELPSDKVGLLIGKRGEDVQKIRKATGTYVHFDPAQDGIERQTLTIRGPMLKVYRAHALLMKRYHETHETQAEDVAVPESQDTQRVQELEEQLQQLQRQVEEVKQLRAASGPERMPKGGKGHQGKGRKGR